MNTWIGLKLWELYTLILRQFCGGGGDCGRILTEVPLYIPCRRFCSGNGDLSISE